MSEETKTNFQRVAEIIAEVMVVKEEAVKLGSSLVDDLGMDDLDLQEVILSMELEFNVTITDEEAEAVKTVHGLVRLVPE